MTRLLFQLGLRSSERTPGPVAVRPFSIWGPSWRYPPGRVGEVSHSHFGRTAFCNPLPSVTRTEAARPKTERQQTVPRPDAPKLRPESARFGYAQNEGPKPYFRFPSMVAQA